LAPVALPSPVFYSIGGDDSGIPRRLIRLDADAPVAFTVFDLGTTADGFSSLTYRGPSNEFFAVHDDGLGTSNLVSFQLSSGGSFTSVLPLTTAPGDPVFNGGLIYDSADGNFYAIANTVQGDSNFYRIDLGTGILTPLFQSLGQGYHGGVTYRASDDSFYAIQIDPYGSSSLQRIAVSGNTGQLTPLFQDFGFGFYGGLSFDAAEASLYALNTDPSGVGYLNRLDAGVPATLMFAGNGVFNTGLTLGASTVPEPASLAPAGAGLLLFFLRRKR